VGDFFGTERAARRVPNVSSDFIFISFKKTLTGNEKWFIIIA
jgi:hypothetical protein